MRLAIAILLMLVTATVVHAQSRDGFTGPLTGYEAELLSDVWSEIRQVEDFDGINWPAHGLNRAPASPDAQRFLAANWDELRREERFGDIEWDEYGDRSKRSSRAERSGRLETGFPENETDYDSPFTREETAALSRAWGQIREAARFEDIDWRAIGFSGAPGDRDARRLMSANWGQLREAGRFEDIDWQAATRYRAD
jgi:hypothetical protein